MALLLLLSHGMFARLMVLVSLATGSLAAAQPGTVPAQPSPLMAVPGQPMAQPPLVAKSYANSIAIADGVAGGLTLAFGAFGIVCIAEALGEGGEDPASCYLALGAGAGAVGTYALAPAVIHLQNGRPARALGSIAVRVGLPVAAGYLTRDMNDDAAGWAILGGIGGAILIDWFVLAAPEKTAAPPALTPAVMPARGGGVIGLAGHF